MIITPLQKRIRRFLGLTLLLASRTSHCLAVILCVCFWMSVPAVHLIAADAPAGKPYIYKESAEKPRQMEIYFPPNHDPAKAKVPGMILFHGGGWEE